MFNKIAAAVIAASLIAAPAMAATASVSTAAPSKVVTTTTTVKAGPNVKVVKKVRIAKHRAHHVRAKHVKVIKMSHARKHHRAHVARHLPAPVKQVGRI
jgi:hypothetical protein